MKKISPPLPTHTIVTIGRSFGAGGRELGHLLSQRLGIPYYDKELLSEAAARSGLYPGLFEENDERAPGFLSALQPMSMGMNSYAWYTGPKGAGSESVYAAQADFIREIASRGPCIIVGRTADYVLRDFPGTVNVFLHAPEESCLDRITGRGDCDTREKARVILRKTNRLRADFYNFYTDKTWGATDSYDLTVDTSRLSPSAAVDVIAAYIAARNGAPAAK